MAADPGGNFASDAHRRVMAHLPNPDDTALKPDELKEERVDRDEHLRLTTDELDEILADLEADGDATKLKSGAWKNTKAGFKALTGPTVEDGGRNHELRSEK